MRSKKQLLWWLFSGTRGGYNRALMVLSLQDEPKNAHQLALGLKLDYKTVRHHLSVLEKNGLVTSSGNGYGNCYFLRDFCEDEWETITHIYKKMGLVENK